MPVVAGTEVFQDVRVPGNQAAQVRANIGKDPDICGVLSNGKYAMAGDRVLPSVLPLADKTKKSGNPNGYLLELSKGDPCLSCLLSQGRRNEKIQGWQPDPCADDCSHGSSYHLDKVSPADGIGMDFLNGCLHDDPILTFHCPPVIRHLAFPYISNLACEKK